MLINQTDIDHIRHLLLRHVGTIPDAFVRIEIAMISYNTDLVEGVMKVLDNSGILDLSVPEIIKLVEEKFTPTNNGSTPCQFFSRDKVCIGKTADGVNMYQSVPWCNHEPSQCAVP